MGCVLEKAVINGWIAREEGNVNDWLELLYGSVYTGLQNPAVKYGWSPPVSLLLTWLLSLNNAVVVHGSTVSGPSRFWRPEDPPPTRGELTVGLTPEKSWAPSMRQSFLKSRHVNPSLRRRMIGACF